MGPDAHANLIVLVSLLYPGVLLAVASYGDSRADRGCSLIRNR
ncbi:MAG: hypothetical protein ACJ8H8_01135 [Geminicoccaceae bacterium]